MQITKVQHYVPQFYLKLFSANKKSIGMYRHKGHHLIEHASIKGVAYRNYLYGEDGVIEKWLSEHEGKWSNSINYLLGRTDDVPVHEVLSHYISLLHFVAISLSRTAQVADGYLEFLKYQQNLFDEAERAGGKLAFNKADFFKNMCIPNALPIEIANETIEVLADLTPLIIINETPRGFITSDVPVVEYNLLYAQRKYNINYGQGSGGLIIFLPLCETVCLCYYDAEVYSVKSPDSGIATITSINQINELNKLFCMNAYECLFFGVSCAPDYIQRIATHMQTPRSVVSEYSIHGTNNTLLRYGNDSIHKEFQIPVFKTKSKYKNLVLPNNMGGLHRKAATDFMNWYETIHGLNKWQSFKITE